MRRVNKMDKEKLIKSGISRHSIHEIKIYLDELIETGFEDEREFFEDYLFHHDRTELEGKVLHYYITGTDGKRINILVWLEKY